MKVILLADVQGVGKQQQVIDVKSGYANNFLLKKGLAVVANDENMKKLNEQLAIKKAEEEAIKAQAEAVKETVKDKSVKITASGGPDGKLYGSITSMDISSALTEQFNVDVDKRKVVLDSPIKSAGTYTVKLKLHPKVETTIYAVVTVK